MFIVFEGIDGSGKTTQAELLKKSLEGRGFFVVLTEEPTKDLSNVSQKIRKILNKEIVVPPKKLQELFIQDRREHLEKLIIPNLKEGKIVISDRYYFSTIAYGTSEGISTEWLIKKNKDFIKPNLTFIIDIDASIGVKRIIKSCKPLELFEKIEKLRLIQEEYKKLSKYFNNLIYIDGEQSVNKIHQKILSFISINSIKKQIKFCEELSNK